MFPFDLKHLLWSTHQSQSTNKIHCCISICPPSPSPLLHTPPPALPSSLRRHLDSVGASLPPFFSIPCLPSPLFLASPPFPVSVSFIRVSLPSVRISLPPFTPPCSLLHMLLLAHFSFSITVSLALLLTRPSASPLSLFRFSLSLCRPPHLLSVLLFLANSVSLQPLSPAPSLMRISYTICIYVYIPSVYTCILSVYTICM